MSNIDDAGKNRRKNVRHVGCRAAAKSGRSVLQLEQEDGYGGPWASLHLDELRKVAARNSSSANGFIYGCKIYEMGSLEELGSSRCYCLDISPHVIHGMGPLIKILLGSGAHNYTEYKLIKTTVIRDPRTGKAQTVPCSRAEIFRDQNLSPLQKRTLMRFLKTYTAALNQPSDANHADVLRFTSNDVSFVSLLNEIEGMDEMLQRCLVHGVLLQPALQDDDSKTTTITCQKAARLVKMYTNSLGRYGIDAGPFLIPMHGFGELPQAFCRTAAVHGAVQVLRCGVEKYEYDSGTQLHHLTVEGTNQEVKSQFLAATHRLLHSQAALPAAGAEGIIFSPEEQGEQMEGIQLPKGAVHRCIAIVNGPTQLTSEAQALLIIPTTSLGTLTSESACNTVWGLQLGPGSGVAPTNTPTPLWVLHLWCESNGDFTLAEQSLLPCLKTLVSVDPPPSSSPSSSTMPSNAHVVTSAGDSTLPRALFVAFFSIPVDPNRSSTVSGTSLPKGLVFCPGPTSEVGVVEAIDVAKRLYYEMLGPSSEITAKYSNYDINGEGLEDDFPLSPEFTSNKGKGVDGDEGINGEANNVGVHDVGVDELSQELAALQNALGLISESHDPV